MNISPFRIEHYYGRHEFSARYMLSSADAETWSVGALLRLEDGAHERLQGMALGYTEAPGSPELRDAVAATYERLEPDDVLVVSSAEEGIFLLYHAILRAGDHTVVETPCYESAVQVARSTGADVDPWRRRAEDGWEHDQPALAALIRPETRVLYVNTPHNPTGRSMKPEVYGEVLALARENRITLLSDEVYRGLEHDPRSRLSAACDELETAVSLGSVSKTYGLPGLRLGWLASRDRDLLRRVRELKYYTTICNSAPSELLTAVAVRQRHRLHERNLEIVRRNLGLLDPFIARHASLLSWRRPDAGSIGFVRMGTDDVDAFCADLLRHTGVLLLPGSVYDEPGHARFGYGRANMPEALALLDGYLHREPAR